MWPNTYQKFDYVSVSPAVAGDFRWCPGWAHLTLDFSVMQPGSKKL